MTQDLALTLLMLFSVACGSPQPDPARPSAHIKTTASGLVADSSGAPSLAELPSTEAETDTETTSPRPSVSVPLIALASGDTLEVVSGVATLCTAEGVKIAENARLIREKDPPGTVCPFEGFMTATGIGEGFLLHNSLCSGGFFIIEILTFALVEDEYRLVRFSAEYIDRRAPKQDVSQAYVLTETDFGRRRFQDLNPDDLYLHLNDENIEEAPSGE